MDMHSRNQYLKELRSEYLKTRSKKKRGELLDEAEKRTKLNRKYLMEKLKPRSNLDNLPNERKKKEQYYDNGIRPALVQMWRMFNYPCGQRLEPLLKSDTDRLRELGELSCEEAVAKKLKQMSPATIDRKLKRQKEIELVGRKYARKVHPLLYQKIPVKVFGEQDRSVLGNVQLDLVEHCGQSAAGEFIYTLSSTDINSGWWEGGAIMGRGQEGVFQSLKQCQTRFPFPWSEIHSDNDTAFINWHLLKYCEKEKLDFSRSRPYKKNDNCLVEQKNWTHVKRFVGYSRYETQEELEVLNDLYLKELRLFKNFFQPQIKLILKERVGGKIRRRYDAPKTPYHRLLESKEVPEAKKRELRAIYLALNPARLKRAIDNKLNLLYKINNKVDVDKKISVRFVNVRRDPVSVR